MSENGEIEKEETVTSEESAGTEKTGGARHEDTGKSDRSSVDSADSGGKQDKKARSSKKTREKRERYKGVFHAGVDSVTDKLYGFFKSSYVGRAFSGGDAFEKKVQDSFFCTTCKKIKSGVMKRFRKQPKRVYDADDFGGTVGIFDENSFGKPFKVRVNKAFSSSAILRLLNRLLSALMFAPVVSFGLFLLSLGISTVGVQAVRFLIDHDSAETIFSLAVGILLLISAIPALISRDESIGESMRSSFIGRFILYSLMGVGDEWGTEKKKNGKMTLPLFIAGVLLGLLTYFVSPMYLLMAILVSAIAVRTIYMPETGVVFLIAVLPFIPALRRPDVVCLCVSLYISACFFIKVLMGKRSADLVFTDFLVAMFGLVCVVTSSGSGDGRLTAGMYLSFMLMYYVVRNIIRSGKWANRCVSAWIASSLALAIMMTLVFFFGKVLQFELPGNVEAVRWYVSVGIIISASKFFASPKRRAVPAIIIAAQTASLAVTGAWIALTVTCVSLFILFMVCSRKTIIGLVFVILAIPFVSFFVTKLQVSGFIDMITFSDGSQSYRVDVWHTSWRILTDRFAVGIGLGRENFAQFFKEYAPAGLAVSDTSMSLVLSVIIQLGIIGFLILGCIFASSAVKAFTLQKSENGERMYKYYGIGYFAALFALAVFGVFYDVWSSEVTALAFWMLTGFVSSCAKCEKLSDDSGVDVMNEYSADMHIEFR